MRGNDVTRPGVAVMITTVSPTPTARTRSRTSPGPIFGTGTMAGLSGAPKAGSTIARIVDGVPALRGGTRGAPGAPRPARRHRRVRRLAARLSDLTRGGAQPARGCLRNAHAPHLD